MKNNKAAIIFIVIFAVIVMVIAAASCEKFSHNEQRETVPMAFSQEDYYDKIEYMAK